jgi:superfamily II DNA/RNA helicase
MEHMGVSSGFTLAHLRFVVIDEADRLLGSATAMASITELLNHLESCTKMVC